MRNLHHSGDRATSKTVRFFVQALSVPVLVTCLISSTQAEDWLGFRGTDGQGHVEAEGLPTDWSLNKNLVWKQDLPGVNAVVYPGVGHIPMEEIPVITAKDAHQFFMGVESERVSQY